jgi:hypothetical protein
MKLADLGAAAVMGADGVVNPWNHERYILSCRDHWVQEKMRVRLFHIAIQEQ